VGTAIPMGMGMVTMMNPRVPVGILWRFSNGCEKRVKHVINKQKTIIYVKCCADLFVCLTVFFYLLRLFNFCLLFFFHLCCATIYDGEMNLYKCLAVAV